jgi:hypothetical protein
MQQVHIAFLACLAAGCASSEQIQAEFAAHVEDSNECTSDGECAVIYPGCPLGCSVAVNIEHAEECEAYAADLIASYERGGTRCEYDCIAVSPPYCDEGRCAVDPLEP